MRFFAVTAIAFSVLFLAACSNPHKDAARAQESVHKANEKVVNQRLALIEKHQKCVSDAAGDTGKAEACDSYLKAAEALK